MCLKAPICNRFRRYSTRRYSEGEGIKGEDSSPAVVESNFSQNNGLRRGEVRRIITQVDYQISQEQGASRAEEHFANSIRRTGRLVGRENFQTQPSQLLDGVGTKAHQC